MNTNIHALLLAAEGVVSASCAGLQVAGKSASAVISA